MFLEPGTPLRDGAYVVGDVLGHGGFGITYRALDTALQREVAIKELFPAGCQRAARGREVLAGGGWSNQSLAEARQRFLTEGQILASFDHPGIVRMFAQFSENGTAYLVMELLVGTTLKNGIAASGPMAEEWALRCASEVGHAMQAVHAAGLLHRDINPSNIMYVPGRPFVLIDFGTAREVDAGTSSVLVTPGYAPLEQYAPRASKGPDSDVYALAATLYFLLSGQAPPAATDRSLGAPLVPLTAVAPLVSPHVASVIEAGMDMTPARRPPSMGEFIRLLTTPDGAPVVDDPLTDRWPRTKAEWVRLFTTPIAMPTISVSRKGLWVLAAVFVVGFLLGPVLKLRASGFYLREKTAIAALDELNRSLEKGATLLRYRELLEAARGTTSKFLRDFPEYSSRPSYAALSAAASEYASAEIKWAEAVASGNYYRRRMLADDVVYPAGPEAVPGGNPVSLRLRTAAEWVESARRESERGN